MTTTDKIKHLYWRAGFGRSPEEWEKMADWSLQKAIDELFLNAGKAEALKEPNLQEILGTDDIENIDPKEKAKLLQVARQKVGEQNHAWVSRMANSNESALLERISLFWHGHFACDLKNPILAVRQLNTFRRHGLGSFRDLVQAMAKDAAMIRYLNNQQNRKQKPNENFAREVMELFTIGRDHYTEKDIKEAARAFTGWSSNVQGDFVFRSRQHDYDSKVFMGHVGTFNGEEIIDIILEQKATAFFICRKIYRYFVNEKIDEKILADLAEDFYQSDYNIEKLLRRIFTSDWFYDAPNVGNKIKSPVELIVGMMRSLGVNFSNAPSLTFAQKALGQVLFHPPNVAGWPGGKNWIDNSTLMLRLNLATYFYDAADVSFQVKDLEAETLDIGKRKLEATTDFTPLLQLFQKQKEEAIFSGLQDYFLAPLQKIDKAKIDPFVLKNNTEDYIKSTTLRLMSLPEYQLC